MSERFSGRVDECYMEGCPYTKDIFVPSDIVKGSSFAFVGEQPGETEIEEGRVFCGRAGSKFDHILSSVNLSRENVSILNTVKCFNPSKGKPSKETVELCSKLFLKKELEYIRPKVIVPMGDYALRGTLGITGITANRGMVINYPHFSARVVPTYHPAYILRNPRNESTVVADFKTAKRVMKHGEFLPGKPQFNYKVLDNANDIVATLYSIQADKGIKRITTDTETTGLESWRGHYMTALAIAAGNMTYVILLHDTSKVPIFSRSGIPLLPSMWNANELHLIKVAVRDLFHSKRIIFQNGKFDLHFLMDWCGLDLEKIAFEDTMLLSYLLNEEGRHDLEAIVAEYTDAGAQYKKVLQEAQKASRKNAGFLKPSILSRYVAGDTALTQDAYTPLRLKVRADNGLNFNYTSLLKPLTKELIYTEKKGIKVNIALLNELKKRYNESAEKARYHMQVLAGDKNFNPASQPQLLKVLTEYFRLPFTGTTNEPTVKTVIYGLNEDSAWDRKCKRFLTNLIRFRKDSKIGSTFIDGILNHVDKFGRVHTNFGSTKTVTERLSSSDPNLQNQLKDDDWRKVFIARKGYKLISADYSQVELRLIAQFSNDETMIKAFEDGEDIHSKSAEIIFGDKFKRGTDKEKAEMRKFGKTTNFSVVYGVSAMSLYQRIKVSFEADGLDMPYTEEEVSEFLNTYFNKYSGLGKFVRNFPHYVEKEKVLTAPFGNKRRLFLESPKDMFKQERSHKQREGLNFFPQTSAAGLTNSSYIIIGGKLRERRYPAWIVLQVHDQLMTEAREDCVDTVGKLMKSVMERPIKELGGHSYPVDIAVGDNWGQMEKWSN